MTEIVEELREYAKDWRDRAASKDIVDRAADRIQELEAEMVEKQKLVQQLWDKQTCMCGSLVDGHGIRDGHSPVPMFDYALYQAESALTASEARVADLREACGAFERAVHVDATMEGPRYKVSTHQMMKALELSARALQGIPAPSADTTPSPGADLIAAALRVVEDECDSLVHPQCWEKLRAAATAYQERG